jgi:hypothetical protein
LLSNFKDLCLYPPRLWHRFGTPEKAPNRRNGPIAGEN